MSQKKMTINDVAARAGVSVTTVSLVLSGKGRISAATAARVNQVIDELGFVRNRSAAMLRGEQSGVVGLIVRNICHPFYAEVTAGLSEVLEAEGKVLFLAQSGMQGQNMDRCFDTLIAQGVEGIVVGGGAEKASHLVEQAREQDIALVCASRAAGLAQVDTVRPDNLRAAQMATEYLIHQGHHCIAWLGGRGSSLTRAERIGGYCATLMQYGLPFRSEWIIECGQQQDIAALTEQLINQYPTITAILCHNASVVLGCYFGLLQTGRASGKSAVDSYYGQHMALVGFGDATDELTVSSVTFVTSPAREIGRSAARRLLQRIRGESGASQNIILPPTLIESGAA